MWSRRHFLSHCTATSAGLLWAAHVRANDKPEAKKAEPLLTPAAQKAIESGMKWLKEQQHKDGSFGTAAYRGSVGITSLCGLALLSGGHRPGIGVFGPALDTALDFVLSKEDPPYEPYEVREKCEAFRKSTSSDFTSYSKVSPESRTKFAQLNTEFKLTPGSSVSAWGPHCAQVDGANSHGLDAYLPQTLPVSLRTLKAKLAAEDDFSIGCWQAASVDHSSPTRHTFSGEVRMRVVFEF